MVCSELCCSVDVCQWPGSVVLVALPGVVLNDLVGVEDGSSVVVFSYSVVLFISVVPDGVVSLALSVLYDVAVTVVFGSFVEVLQ